MSDVSTFCRESLYERQKSETCKTGMISDMNAFIENPRTRMHILKTLFFLCGHFCRESLHENEYLNENDALT